jgi:hypothetical protein
MRPVGRSAGTAGRSSRRESCRRTDKRPWCASRNQNFFARKERLQDLTIGRGFVMKQFPDQALPEFSWNFYSVFLSGTCCVHGGKGREISRIITLGNCTAEQVMNP